MPTINRKVLKFTKQKQELKFKPEINYAGFYNSGGWKQLRNKYIKEHPLCEECLKEGIVTPADEVHHIFPFGQGANDSERWDLLLDEDNLMSLCIKHHKEKHKMLKDR